MFRQRRQQRRLAAWMVLAWLLALATGIVNACVVEPALTQGRLVAQHAHAVAAAAEDHAATHAEHGTPAPHADQAPCAKFCDESSSSAPTAQQQADRLLLAWAPPPSLSLAPPLSVEPADKRHDDDAGLRAAVPIPIAFLRLAL